MGPTLKGWGLAQTPLKLIDQPQGMPLLIDNPLCSLYHMMVLPLHNHFLNVRYRVCVCVGARARAHPRPREVH